MSRKTRHKLIIALVLMNFISMAAGIPRLEKAWGEEIAASAPATPGRSAALPSFVELAEVEKKSVVNISTTKVIKGQRRFPFPFPRNHQGQLPPDMFDDFFDRFFGGPNHPQPGFTEKSLGSGFIISKEGYILTNFHVVDGADEILVKLSTEKTYPAKVVGKDKKTDIALIKIDTDHDLPVADLGDSDALKVGEWVMAAGNPFGLEHTITVGIVSAKGRVIGAGPYDDFIQTDASINPGNSGGPLFNTKGQVVGINTAIVASGQGIGFAIPINMARDIIPQLREAGKVTRGWLGLVIQRVTPELAKALKLEKPNGALVAEVVKDSPAATAGIKQGDVVVKFDGQEIRDEGHLSRLAAATKVGRKVDVELIRGGKLKEMSLKLGQFPEEDGEEAAAEQSDMQEKLGLAVQNLSPELQESLGLERDLKGVFISRIEPGSPADKASPALRNGDIIIEVNHTPITTVDEFKEQIAESKPDQHMLILFRRGKSTLFTTLKKE